ncbi:MAG TPA: hypothetical protein VJ731_00635 [Terriglobales bacterium]|nr:hypothetical protein [Terriglobales bacterium]
MQRTKASTAEKPFSTNELKASALASRIARKQLLRVPWNVFFQAYEEYPRWQGLSLWTREAARAHKQTTAELLSRLRKYCPELVETEVFVREPDLMGFRLLEWVHNSKFGYAKRKGWLDALSFYGARHFRSRAVWAYWEQCENKPGRFSSNKLMSFDEWWQRAMEMKICSGSINCAEIAPAVEKYIEWEAVANWVRPLIADLILTERVLSELKSRLPDRQRQAKPPSDRERKTKFPTWLSAIRAGKKRCLREAQEAGCLDWFKEVIQSHPRPTRLRGYATHCEESPRRNWLRNYPSFREWLLASDQFIRKSRIDRKRPSNRPIVA